MQRKEIKKVKGAPAIDGAGVHLVRVLGYKTVEDFDPVLMLDSFDSQNPEDYQAGFPEHPHRGIETISYLASGQMMHKDSLGFSDTVGDGEVQWMTAGSGIIHEELLPESERLLGVQLWLNLPAADKMCEPEYRSIKNDEIQEIEFAGGKLRLIAGNYQDKSGVQGKHLPLDYYDIQLEENSSLTIDSDKDRSIMLFTLLGEVFVEDELIESKTAAKLSEGEKLTLKTGDQPAQLLFISSKALKEPVVWGGPVVMNSREELFEARREISKGTFIKHK